MERRKLALDNARRASGHLLAILMLSSLILMTLNPTYAGALGATWTLQQSGTGFAEISAQQAHSQPNSVKLVTVATSDWARVVFLGQGETLSQVTSLSYWSYVTSAPGNDRLRPWVGIYLDSNGDLGTYEYYLQAEPMYTSDPSPPAAFNTWEYWDAYAAVKPLRWVGLESPDTGWSSYEAPLLQDYISGAAVAYLTSAHGVQSYASREYGSLTVIKIVFMAGYGSTWTSFTGYVDDVRILNHVIGFDSYTLHSVNVYVKDATSGRGIADAQISLDGAPKGTTNLMGLLTITGVAPGTHTASASKAGYAAATVTFSATRSTTVLIPLTPTPTTGTLTIQVSDASSSAAIALAMVYLDGRYVGATNVQGQLTLTNVRAGTHTFTVIKSGYATRIQTATLPGWTVTVLLARR